MVVRLPIFFAACSVEIILWLLPNTSYSVFKIFFQGQHCLLLFYFIYCNICVLNNVNGACWWTFLLVALRVPEMCFWLRRTMIKMNFLRCVHVLDLVLKLCSDINKGLGVHIFFCCIVLVDLVALFIGMSFFHPCVRFFSWNFLVLQCYGNVCTWLSKKIWPRQGKIWSFLLDYSSFRQLHTQMDWKFARIAQISFFLQTSNLFDS